MGLIAAITAAFAFFYYPKPVDIVVDTQINQDLFESYNTGDVRSIAITKFDDETNRIEQFRLRRKGDNWIMPQSGDIPATGIARIGEVAKSLLERKVLAKASDDEQAHFELGVGDPTESGSSPNRASLGMKIELKDRDRTDIASLIIGNPVSKSAPDGKYFVRVPGQPTVYEMEIPKEIFSIRFEDWMDRNLLGLPRQGGDTEIDRFNIEKYLIDPKTIATADRENNWQITLDGKSIQVSQWKDDKFESIDVTNEIQTSITSKIGGISQIRIVGATGKPKSTVKPLRDPADIEDTSILEGLSPFGFRGKKSDGKVTIESANGTLSATTTDGVTTRLLIGSLANQTDSRTLDLNYHAIVLAELDESFFEKPQQPQGVQKDSPENKAWLRKVAAIDNQRVAANLQVESINRSHANWIYIIPESVVDTLIPELELP